MNVEIRGLAKSFGQVQALHPTDLMIRQGRFTTLLGPSGCGKTTLLRMIAGLEQPDQGDLILGEDVLFSASRRIDRPPHKRQFGMVFQDFALWPHMTVYENIAFGLRATGQTKELKQRVGEAIERVRLQGMDKRYPHQLSGGQQQRVAFARAVAMKPALVLFDEPLSALDAVLRDEMRLELMSLVQDAGLTALYVTHDQTEAMSMSDDIVVMQAGRILQQGSPEDIYKRPSDPFVARFIGRSNWIAADQTLVRPEHVGWTEPAAGESAESFQGIIRSVSYLGDRYEIGLDMGELGTWTAYHESRLHTGVNVPVYVLTSHIHHIRK
ncbi:ABC transporter ATP-binding protein [Paenibacillus filicis]|uniref:ABC transporter ATP-binding protein n=1 Tax=Paenibacillus filicis TaxID=669464 RepID=A0ABU9DJZ5_9BACL